MGEVINLAARPGMTSPSVGSGQKSTLAEITPMGALVAQLYGVLKSHAEVGMHVPHLMVASLVEQIEDVLRIGEEIA